jgi:hypothetical protein
MKYKIFFAILFLEALLLTFLMVSASISSTKRTPDLKANQQLVKNLMLTDLSLWTEARYSRHPSQADFFAPFQDFPAAIERFPAGSLTAPAKNRKLSHTGPWPNLRGRTAEKHAYLRQATRK